MAVIRELGYPSRRLIPIWYKDYLKEQETGVIQKRCQKAPKYTDMQKQIAIEHYLSHGRCQMLTRRTLGYPGRELMLQWCREYSAIPSRRSCYAVQYSQEQKQNAVIALCSRQDNAKTIAKAYGVSRAAIYKWKTALLGEESDMAHEKKVKDELPNDKDQLLLLIEDLKKDIQRLKMEKDILEAAAELIKKDPGVDLKDLSNREKTIIIDALKHEYSLKSLLAKLHLSKSSYYYQRWAQGLESKYEILKGRIVELFDENHRCYGYRRIHSLLSQEGTKVSEKIVRALMFETGLIAMHKRKRKYSSYQGEITPAPENLLARDFHADKPNLKWLTDITEFHIPAGKAYLSPIVDCFDGLLVSWTMSTRPDAELVNTMLDMATRTLSDNEKPIVHSDRGGHYRWPDWLKRIEKAKLVRSMSKKACSPDNSACEGVFGRIKNELFYNRTWENVTIESFMETLDGYLHWYNSKRIKMSLGGLSPIQYRLRLGMVP